MKNTNRYIAFIFVTILVDSIGVGIIFPVMATLINQITGSNLGEDSTYGGLLMSTYAAMQFICAPILGGISDRYGRRPVLLISLFGLGIDYLFLAVANTLPLLFLGRLIAGIGGASFTTGFAYIADVSAPEKKAQNFGLVGAAFGLGFIIGPLLGGLLSGLGPRAPFIAAACLSLLNFLYGLFILPESLKPENRRPFNFKRANPFGAFRQMLLRKDIRLLVLVMFLLYTGGQAMPATWAFFTKYKFDWSDKMVGYSLAFVGLVVAAVQGVLIRLTQKKFGNHPTVVTGLILYTIGMLLFAFAGQAWMMFGFTLIYALGGVAPPTIQATISSRVAMNEQGETQGLITSVTSIASIVSPLLMTQLFKTFTQENAPLHFPGAAFMAATLLFILALLFYLVDRKRMLSSGPVSAKSPE